LVSQVLQLPQEEILLVQVVLLVMVAKKAIWQGTVVGPVVAVASLVMAMAEMPVAMAVPYLVL
jgi:hypothetical protein